MNQQSNVWRHKKSRSVQNNNAHSISTKEEKRRLAKRRLECNGTKKRIGSMKN